MTASLSLRSTVTPSLLALGAAAGGLAFGFATSYGQGALDGSWNTLANSGAVWTLVAFLLALVCVRSAATAVTAGLLALVGEVAGYYAIAMPYRGYSVLPREEVLWTMAALVFGPLAGAAAYYWRRGSAGQKLTAQLTVAGIVGGEALYTLRFLQEHSAAGWIELLGSGGLALVALARTEAAIQSRFAAIATGAVIAGAVYVAYTDPLLF
jgi:hypothetical protein